MLTIVGVCSIIDYREVIKEVDKMKFMAELFLGIIVLLFSIAILIWGTILVIYYTINSFGYVQTLDAVVMVIAVAEWFYILIDK
jgi:uncharacterized membrane protein YcjF (UPF0283 family)